MSLFFWILIGTSSLVLLLLLTILIAEIGNNLRVRKLRKESVESKQRRKEERKKPSPRRETPKRGVRTEAATGIAVPPETQEIPAPAAQEVPSVAEEVLPSEPAESSAELQELEPFEFPETEAVAEEAEIGEVLREALPPGEEAELPAETAFEPTPYPEFSNARAVEELGLSQEEADLFMSELVAQIEEELPNLDAAVAANDVERVERVSHMLKGSSTNLGTGGVADVLVAFNTYCKTGRNIEVIQSHMQDLRFYLGQLKAQFGL